MATVVRCNMCEAVGNKDNRIHHLVAKHNIIIIGNSQQGIEMALSNYFVEMGET